MISFAWDDEKAAENYAKHGVSFEFAKLAFEDLLAVERIDDRHDYGEQRFILIGMARAVVLFVVYVEREERIRLISARRATTKEYDLCPTDFLTLAQ
jgi:hypothetical protein